MKILFRKHHRLGYLTAGVGAIAAFAAVNRPIKSDIKILQTSDKMEMFVKGVQTKVTSALEKLELDGRTFHKDSWMRDEGGYGCSAVLQDGKTFEKAGVNYSVIRSPAPKAMLDQMRHRLLLTSDEMDMFVAGVSIVVHPANPMAPTFHANYRYFELKEKNSDEVKAAWFGGGCDLTPSYLFKEDAVHFHTVIKGVCDNYDATYYGRFKKWCDVYFVNKHRGENRGVGGIFFDDLEGDHFDFVQACGDAIVTQYIPILEKRINMYFTKEQKKWQSLRRGRYVEFNLVRLY